MNLNGNLEGVRDRVKDSVDIRRNPFAKFVYKNKGDTPQLYDSGK